MRVLMIAPQPFFEPRGTPISVYQRLHALSALGHQVDLLTFHVGQDVDIPGVRIYRVPAIPFIKHIKTGPSGAKLFLDVLLFFKAIIMLATNRYEVLHSHEEAAFMSALLAAIFGVRHVYDMHSSLPRQLVNFGYGNYWPVVKLFELLERWTLNSCDALITIGTDLTQYASKINPGVNQITVENLAIHSLNFSPNPGTVSELRERLNAGDKVTIVYTGTFESYQGLGLLLESVALVREHQPDVLFLLVGGNASQVKYWRNKAKQWGIEDCVIFVGTVSPAEALTFLDLADILISPRIEGTSVPLKIYSYLHAGKPIVATNLTAHTQVLDDDIALLVDPSKEALAGGILKLMASTELRLRFGEQAREFAKEKFDPSDYLAKLNRIYRSLLPPGDLAEPTMTSHEPSALTPSKRSFSSNPPNTPPRLWEEI